MHYVCSDIHGQYGLYRQMKADLCLGEDDTLFILGDVIDRGPEIFPLLLDVMEDPRVHCLFGNHEWLMTDYAAGDSQNGRWFHPANRGSDTWQQFMALPEETRGRILNFFHHLDLQTEVQVEGVTFLLSHSFFLADRGTVPWKDVTEEEVYHTVWDSPWRERQHVEMEDYLTDGRIHVIGHVPVQMIGQSGRVTAPGTMVSIEEIRTEAAVFPRYHLINIDLGCAMIPRYPDMPGLGLCCMCLEDYVFGREAFRYYRVQD